MAPRLHGDRWKNEGPLGEGGQGHAFRVSDTTGEYPGASVLKRLKNSQRLGRFEQEVKALQAMASPRIPTVLDYSLGPEAFVVTPLLGEPLTKFLQEHGGSTRLALEVGEQVAGALVAAHSAGIAHRDIKPDNVIVRVASDGRIEAFLIDFGICQWDDSGIFSTVEDEAFGNPAFAAPECGLGSPVAEGLPSDIYSLGKLMFWIGTGGAHIFREDISDDSIAKLVQKNGVEAEHLRRLLNRMVTPDPAERPAAGEILGRIREARRMIEAGASRLELGISFASPAAATTCAENRTCTTWGM